MTGRTVSLCSSRCATSGPDVDPEEARILNGLLFDPVFVCNACAGWYGADAIQVTADEAS